MKTTKKIIAIVLSVMLLLSVMPFAAFAADVNLSDILASATSKYVEIEGEDIVVDADTTLTGHILDLYGNVTIDLAGHNLVAGAANSSGQEVAIWINPGANVTITDSAQPSTAATYSSSTGVLTVKSGVAAISSTYYGIINEGNLTLGKAVVKGDNNAVCLTAGSTLTTTEANSIICGGTYGVTYPGGTATLNLNKGMIYGQYGLSGNSSWDSANSCYKFGGNTINIGTAKIYGKGMDDGNDGIVNGAAIVLGADDDCNITGNATITGFDAPAIVTRASADLDITASPTVTTNGTLTNVKVLDGATSVPCAPVVVDTACGYTKAEDIDVDIANGTYKANIAGVSNAIALVGESGETTADYVAVENGTYTTTTGADTSVPFDDTTYVQDDFGKLFLASEIGTVYNMIYTNTAGKATYSKFSSSAFSSSGTYKLLADVSTTARIAPGTFASNVVIDTNGYNITSSAKDYLFYLNRTGSAAAHKTFDIINTSATASVVEATDAACEGVCVNGSYNDFTLGENVTLKTKDVSAWIGSGTNSSITINGDVESSDCYALYVHGTNAGPNTITVNGNVTGDDAGIYAAGVANYEINGNVTGETGIYVAQGTVNVNEGAKVTGTGANNDYQYNGSGMNSTGDGIAVDSKYATVPSVNVAEGATVESKAADAVAEYKKEESSPAPTVDIDEDATIIEHNYNVEYTSPSGAVSYKNFPSSFSSNGTYKLLDDVTISVRISPSVFTSNVVIDMNGKNLTSSAPDEVFLLGRNGSASAHKTWSVINTSATPSVIEATNPDCDGVVITGSFNDFTLGENVTLKTKDVAAWIGETKANNSITIDGDVETSDCYALYVHGNNAGPNTVTVNGSVKGDAVGIYGAGNADYIINGSVEGDTGIYIKSGALSVNDGATVKGTGTKAAYTYNGSGVNATGDAIVIDNCGYPGGTPDANISGGTILSDNATAVASYVKQDDQTQTGSFDRIDDVVPADSTAKFSDVIDTDLIPVGKKLVDNGDGTYSLGEIVNGANLTLKGDIEEAIYMDADAYGLGDDAVIKVRANASSNVSETPDVKTTTYRVKDLTPYVDPEGTYTGTYKFAFKNAPAQITEEVTVALYEDENAAEPVKTITYSVKDYCDTVIAESNDAKLVALCKSILDYGAAAQTAFDYNTDNMAVDEFYNADAIANLSSSDIENPVFSGTGIKAGSFACFATTDINLYVAYHYIEADGEVEVVGAEDSEVKAVTKTRELSKFINISGIEAGNLLKTVIVSTSAGDIEINSQFLVKTILAYSNNATEVTLAKTIYFYAQAADAYFN